MRADPAVLQKIRALLAKAESTTFEAEAAALTAKAQELMARHALAEALVEPSASADGGPTLVELQFDPPYVRAKSLLLQVVAEAGRCTAVFHRGQARSTLVGFSPDVDGVQLLFTSLLVQAQAQMAASERARQATGGSGSVRAYRSAFMLAFASRIGERLREVAQEAVAEAARSMGPRLLPALRSRSEAVDEVVASRFGRLTRATISASDAAGWAGGTIAADSAELTRAHLSRG